MASEPAYPHHPDMITLRKAEALTGINYQTIHKAARRAQAELEGSATPKLVEAKWEAGDKTCILCGQPIDPTLKAPHNMSRTIEHLTPIARGGKHDLDNIDFAHWGCNASKGTKTLEEY
jgi:5-methylcytosine-specific restriction endonuclease McrA